VATQATAVQEIRPHAGSDHVTPYDRLVWTDDDVERLLASGEQREELEAYFGPQEYRELKRLARAAWSAVPSAGSQRVLIVPGIMGSQLGSPRRAPLPRDILWVDPVDIGFGRLTELALPAAAAPGTTQYGVVLYSYLRIKLHLRAMGIDAVFHCYDWRLGIDVVGRELAQRLQAEPARKLSLVGHSLGGLVSRAALACPGGEKVERLVLLGAPNCGSFGAVQALRGTYSVVRKIARLDWRHSAEALAATTFNTFPSLYHMLPQPNHRGVIDLFDPAAWPRSGPQPSRALLESARTISRMLAPPDGRCVSIVGVGRETVTAVARRRDQFVYTITRHGDGTVPVARARLEGARNFHAAVSHSDLTRDRTVAAAVVDLLRSGSTRRLPSEWTSGSVAEAQVSDRELSRMHAEKIDWASLAPDERREFLQNLNEPPRLRLYVPARLKARRASRRGRVK
jgi:pimeloyl-ACP methyl ester carboxylesterase